MRLTSFVLILAFLVSGCNSLIIRDSDSPSVVTGKVAVRTLNCVLTIWMLCASEWMAMEDAKQEEAFNAWWQQATPEDRRNYQIEQRNRAALILPLLQNQMYLNETQRHNRQMEQLQQNQRLRTNCTTTYSGSQAHTNCY